MNKNNDDILLNLGKQIMHNQLEFIDDFKLVHRNFDPDIHRLFVVGMTELDSGKFYLCSNRMLCDESILISERLFICDNPKKISHENQSIKSTQSSFFSSFSQQNIAQLYIDELRESTYYTQPFIKEKYSLSIRKFSPASLDPHNGNKIYVNCFTCQDTNDFVLHRLFKKEQYGGGPPLPSYFQKKHIAQQYIGNFDKVRTIAFELSN